MKYLAMYQIDPIDYESTIKKIQELGLVETRGGGRPSNWGGPTESQITVHLKDLNSSIQISLTGNIQIRYSSRKNLRKCVKILKKCCIQKQGKRINLRAKGTEDPLDTSIVMKTIDHLQPGDVKYAIAIVKFYHWRDPKSDETILRVEDRDGRVNIPGTRIRVKPERIKIYTKNTPYRFDACIPVGVHCIDKEDSEGNRIITSERLRWQGIQELKRMVKAHPRFKPTEEQIRRSIQKDRERRNKKADLIFVIGEPVEIKFELTD